MADVQKLKGKIVENNYNVESLAKEIGMNRATLYRKINDSKGEKLLIKEARAISQALNLSEDEINSIFFNHNVA